MKRIFAFSSLVFLLSGCGNSIPADNQITGKWEIESENTPGTLTLRANKTFSAETRDGDLSGSWKIDGDRLVGTVAHSTIAKVPTGYTWSNIIDGWSGSRLTLVNRTGEAESYHRIK